MFKISYDKKITMVQGDTGIIRMKIHNYELSQGDEVRFAIVNKVNTSILLCQHSDKKIVLEKQVTAFEKDGSARIIIYPYDTENLQPGKYLYEIQVKTKDGRIDTVVPLASFTLMDGIIQGENDGPTKPDPPPSVIELRFERLENRIANVEKEIDSVNLSLDKNLNYISNRGSVISDKESKKYEQYLILGDNFTNYTNSEYPDRYKPLKLYVDGDICFIQGIIDMTKHYTYDGWTVTTDTWHYQIVKDKYLDAELTPYNGTVTGNSVCYKSDWSKIAPCLIVVRNDGHIMVDRETLEINPDCIKYIIINLTYELGKSYIIDKFKNYINSKKHELALKPIIGSKFVLAADMHISVADVREKQQSAFDFYFPRILSNVSDFTNSLFTICLGDNVSELRSNTKAATLKSMQYLNKMLPENTLFVAGNHDYAYSLGNTSDKYITSSEMYDVLISGKTNLIKNSIEPTKMYYYYDDDIFKVRYIVLNSMDLPNDISKNTPGFMPNQINWLVNTALNFEENSQYDVVVFSHHSLLEPNMLYPTGGEPTVKNATMVKKILENFANGVISTVKSTESKPYNCEVTTNFTTPKKIIHMFGHYHIDYKNKVNNVTHVGFESAYPYVKEASLPTDGNGVDYDRSGDNELSFNVITIDTRNKNMHVKRIGCGNDYVINY